MSRILFLLVLWYGALTCAPVASSAATESPVNHTRSSLTTTEQTATVTGQTTGTLEDEMENQENILTQVTADWLFSSEMNSLIVRVFERVRICKTL